MTRAFLSIGETLIDLIVSDGSGSLEDAGSFAARAGGAPANVAVALSRLGVPSAFCGVVGDDPFGRRLRDTLSQFGVDHSRLRATPERDTTLAFAWKDPQGDGHFRLLRMADLLLSVEDVERAGIPEVAGLVAGSVSLAGEPSRGAVCRAAEIAAEARVPVVFDVNVRPTLWVDRDAAVQACEPLFQRATLVKMSLSDSEYLFDGGDDPEVAMAACDRYPARFVLLTDGARGAWFRDREAGAQGFVPAYRVEVVDPTGAGDAFTAAAISRLVGNGWSGLAEEDVRFASAAGALTTQRRGAMDAIPTPAEVARFVQAGGVA